MNKAQVVQIQNQRGEFDKTKIRQRRQKREKLVRLYSGITKNRSYFQLTGNLKKFQNLQDLAQAIRARIFILNNKLMMQIGKASDKHSSKNLIYPRGTNFESQPAIVQSPLKILQGNFFVQVLVSLHQDQIFIEALNLRYSFKIDFWTTFQQFAKDEQQIGFIVKNNQYQVYIFYTQNKQIISLWKQQMCKKAIIKGFYNDFKPIQKIGSGKTSAVFLAIKRQTNQKFAIKAFLKNDMKDDCLSMQALQNEVRILRMSNNPHIISFEAIYETNKSFYLVMQYVEGKTLRNVLQTSQFRNSQIKHIIKGLLNGLKFLSTMDIAHRDIKPENIIIQKDTNKPVIVDFGLATFCQNKQNHLYKHCGTPGYIAPQILDEESYKVLPKSDIFSLGIILHLLILKRFPYKNATLQTIVKQNKQANFNFQNYQYNDVNCQFMTLIRRMLIKNPNERATASELLEHFNSRQNQKGNKAAMFNRTKKNSKLKEQNFKSLNRSNSTSSIKAGFRFKLQKAY